MEKLRFDFENYRSQIIKKCNSCIFIGLNKDDPDYCKGWTKDRCVWECEGDAKSLVEKANEISEACALTDKEIDQISDELKNNAPEDVKILRNVLANPEYHDEDVVPKMAKLSMNPITGKIDNATDYKEDENEDTYKLSELILGEVRPTYTESTIKTLSQTYGITFEDSYKVLKMIRNIKNQKQEDLYQKLPLPMKQVVEGTIGKPLSEITIDEANEATRDLLLQFQTDAEFNEQFVDLEKSIQASYTDAAKEIGKIEFTSTRDIFTKKLREEELRLADAGKVEESAKVGSVIGAYINSYHFAKQFKYLVNISQKNKRKINDTSKFMTVINAFNEKYKYNTRNIKNIKMLVPILYRRLHTGYPWVTEDILKKFVILTCISCKDMMPENIDEHVYMFYTVQNLAVLDFIDMKQTEEWEFAGEIINNLLNLLHLLKDISRSAKDLAIENFDPMTGYYKMKNFIKD